MKDLNSREKGISRRQFIRISALVAAGVAASSCKAPIPTPTKEAAKKEPTEAKPTEAKPTEAKPTEAKPTEAVAKPPTKYNEAPMLAALVATGQLPPVDERLPVNPEVVAPIEEIGKYGGEWRMLIAKGTDTKMLCVYGHTRLMDWDRTLKKLEPELCESWEVSEDATAYTIHLRKGLKWSDGEPFTTEDLKFWWEDIANNEELSVAGIPSELIVGDEPPEVTFIDDYTFKYEFAAPYLAFGDGLAASCPHIWMFAPKHYLKQFHPKYTDKETIDALVAKEGYENWAALFNDMNTTYSCQNPDRPYLEPWVPVTGRAPATRFVHERNPYFHKVDPEGNQLPYLDRFVQFSTDTALVAMKCTTGDADLQLRGIGFSDVTLLKENEQKGGYEVRMWKSTGGAGSLMPTLSSCQDEVLRQIMLDKRFRVALSHAYDRQEVNTVLYKGYATPIQCECLPGVKGYNEEWATAYLDYDPEKANALLDEMGLEWDETHEYRLRPDGKILHLVIEDSGEDPLTGDVIELITYMFKEIGVNVTRKSTERATYRDRMISGMAAMGWGCAGGLTPLCEAEKEMEKLGPVSAGSGTMWASQWGLWYQTDGGEGKKPPEWVERWADLATDYKSAPNEEKQDEILQEIRRIQYENLPCIGGLSGLPAPVVVKNGFRNVPKEGWNLWEPGGNLGWCKVSQFWKE